MGGHLTQASLLRLVSQTTNESLKDALIYSIECSLLKQFISILFWNNIKYPLI